MYEWLPRTKTFEALAPFKGLGSKVLYAYCIQCTKYTPYKYNVSCNNANVQNLNSKNTRFHFLVVSLSLIYF